jgi:signal peptidase
MDFPDVLKKSYVQTALMIIIAILAVLIFWYGLTVVFRTPNPILAVASESMEPVLYKGDLILIEGINPPDIYAATKDANPPGDIIIFHRPIGPDELIVHRTVEKIDNGDGTYSFKTWGDNNAVRDGWTVDESQVVGKYLGKIPWIGNIALFFTDTDVKIAFIALWVVVLVAIEVLPYLRNKTKKGNNEESLYK